VYDRISALLNIGAGGPYWQAIFGELGDEARASLHFSQVLPEPGPKRRMHLP
jgi:hypothetical protein